MTSTLKYSAHVLAVLCLGYLVAYWLVRPMLAGRYRPPPQPTVHLRVLVNGAQVVLTNDTVNITPDDEVQGYMDVDWQNAQPGKTSLTWEGRPIDPGEVFHATHLGASNLSATAVTNATEYVPSLTSRQSVTFEVNTFARVTATAQVVAVKTGEGGSADIRKITVRLTSDQFDMENIWLSDVSLFFQSGHTDLDRVPVATKGPEGDEPAYLAEFADGTWILQFRRAPEAPPFEDAPTGIMIYGSGGRNNETIDFVATAPFQPSP